MGSTLAQKIAASRAQAGGAAANYYQPPGQQPIQPPPSTGTPYPNQSSPAQYQPYPGPAQPQGPSPGQYGAPTPPSQAPYGAPPNQQAYGNQGRPAQAQGRPPAQAAIPPEFFKQSLLETIQEKQIHSLFPNAAVLDHISQSAAPKVQQLSQEWCLPMEVAQDIVKLALFDIVLFIDDSGSMAFEEGGNRIEDMKEIVSKAAYAASLFDADGIDVRFMNSDVQGNNIRSEQEVESLIASVKFKGLTPMGTQLRAKVIEPLVVQKARANQLRKPVLIIVITDGQPAGEANGAVFDALKYASDSLARTQYGKGAVSFQFAQVGNDLKAREFLGKLDDEPGIGELVDCTSVFEVEQDEMSRAVPPVDLTPDIWLMKLILGAIDSSYDTKDEKASRPAGGAPGGYASPGYAPPGQYGQQPAGGGPGGYTSPGYAPPGQYGQPPAGQYAPPAQGSYGQPPPGPPPGQYGQAPPYGAPPYGAPPAQYGQQHQYGAQQQQRGSQQPYGAPSVPPRY